MSERHYCPFCDIPWLLVHTVPGSRKKGSSFALAVTVCGSLAGPDREAWLTHPPSRTLGENSARDTAAWAPWPHDLIQRTKRIRGKTSREKTHLRARTSVKSENAGSSDFGDGPWSSSLPWPPKGDNEPREQAGSLKPDYRSPPHFLQPIQGLLLWPLGE